MKLKFPLLQLLTLGLCSTIISAVQAQPKGEHYPQTRTHIFTVSEAFALAPAQRRYAINEIYARHGLVFSDMAIRKQFLQYTWYRPTPGKTQKQIETQLGPIERANLQHLASARGPMMCPPKKSVPLNGERFSETRLRLLTADEVAGMIGAKRRYAINEMYARHGLVFKDLTIRKQFLQFKWYQPVIGRTQSGAEARFNSFERRNLKILVQSAK